MKNWIEISFLLITMGIAGLMDVKHRRVSNQYILTIFMVGIAIKGLFQFLGLGITMESWSYAGLFSAAGFLVPIALHALPFHLRMISAADIKLFMVIGALFGLGSIVNIMGLTYLVGGIYAVVVMVTQKSFKWRVRRIYVYAMNCCLSHKLTSYEYVPENPTEREKEQRKKESLPLAMMIFIAVVFYVQGVYII